MNKAASKKLTIGRLAREAGVGIDTVRFYERRGLLPAPERTAAGYRLYDTDAAARILFIRRAKRLGFTLDEIMTLLRLQDEGGKKYHRASFPDEPNTIRAALCRYQWSRSLPAGRDRLRVVGVCREGSRRVVSRVR